MDIKEFTAQKIGHIEWMYEEETGHKIVEEEGVFQVENCSKEANRLYGQWKALKSVLKFLSGSENSL